MKLFILGLLLYLSSIPLWAVVINYNWEEGKNYQYEVETRADYISSGTNMGLKQISIESFHIASKFEIDVIMINKEGTVYAELNLLNFEVITSQGNRIAALFKIPPNAFSSPVTIDKQGNIHHDSKLQLVLSNKGHYLVRNSNDLNTQGTNQLTTLMSYIEFSPYDGNTSDELIECQQESTLISATLNESDPVIDLIPYDFLRLFALPSESIEQDLDYTSLQKNYKTLITAEVVGLQKIYFNSSLSNRATDEEANITYNSRTEYMKTSELFDYKQGMLISLKGSSTKKLANPSMAQEIKQFTKIKFLSP
jgi:hypothetical protein